jgi:hypothetical protein
MNRQTKVEVVVFLLLVLAGSLTRLLLRDLPNFAPVAAIALFAGYFFTSQRIALLVPISVMIVSDCFLGFYDWQMMAVVYGALALPAVASGILRRWLQVDFVTNPTRATAGWMGLMTCSLSGSLFFFAVTNFGSWLWFAGYERSWAGLLSCYVAAIPFFRYTLAGDLFFAVVLFSSYAFAVSWRTQATRSRTRLEHCC